MSFRSTWWVLRDCLASLAFDVSPLEPYKSCGQLVDKAQGFALGSLPLEPKPICRLAGSHPSATKKSLSGL